MSPEAWLAAGKDPVELGRIARRTAAELGRSSLPPPPDDPGELIDFPARTIPADYPYARIDHDRYEPEWVCDKRDCRFDPPSGAVFGTCYLSGHPLGVFVEKFGRFKIAPRSLVDQHSLASLRLTSPVRVADVTDRTILGRWHLTAGSGPVTTTTVRNAGRTDSTKPASPASGAPPRDDVRGGLHSLALFGKPGYQSDASCSATRMSQSRSH